MLLRDDLDFGQEGMSSCIVHHLFLLGFITFSLLCCWWWRLLYFTLFQLIDLSHICQPTFYLFWILLSIPPEGRGVSIQLQSTSFPAGLNHRKAQDRAEIGQEMLCQGIQVSSKSYGTKAGQEIRDLFKVLQAVCGKMRRKPEYPKTSKDYLPLKHNFSFHVRLTSHLGMLSVKGASSTPSTTEGIHWEIKKWCDDLLHVYLMTNSFYLFSATTEEWLTTSTARREVTQ